MFFLFTAIFPGSRKEPVTLETQYEYLFITQPLTIASVFCVADTTQSTP